MCLCERPHNAKLYNVNFVSCHQFMLYNGITIIKMCVFLTKFIDFWDLLFLFKKVNKTEWLAALSDFVKQLSKQDNSELKFLFKNFKISDFELKG